MHLSRQQLCVLEVFRVSGGHEVTNRMLVDACGHRFGGRLLELRRKGFEFGKRQINAGLYVYKLTYDPRYDG